MSQSSARLTLLALTTGSQSISTAKELLRRVKSPMTNPYIAPLLLLSAVSLAPSDTRADETNKWTFDATIYGLTATMSGDVAVGRAKADVDFGFDKIWDNLEFTLMSKVRVGYDRWALTTDVSYMGLGASRNGVSVDMDQWMVEPSLSYRINKYSEVLAGVRYNNLSSEIHGPLGRNPSATQDWWDPIVGANFTYPIGSKFSLNLRGDIGGFGAGSDFTWQVYPYAGWQFAKWGAINAGYRWVYVDYETGSGSSRFEYDMLTQGAQVEFKFIF